MVQYLFMAEPTDIIRLDFTKAFIKINKRQIICVQDIHLGWKAILASKLRLPI